MTGWLVLFALSASTTFAQGQPKAPPSRATVAAPIELLKCKPKGPKEELKVREAAEAQNFSDHEVLARLIYAESLSTGFWGGKCNAPSSEALMEAIGWGIVNRVDKYSPKRDDPKPDAIYHVIFGQKQFRTSFSAKDNPYAVAFLCPLEFKKELDGIKGADGLLNVYTQAKEVAARILEKYQRTGLEAAYSGTTHFFYPYSDFGGESRPAWAKDPDPTKNKGYLPLIQGEKPCVEFYRR